MKSLLPPELQPQWNVRDTVPRRDRLRELAFAGYNIPRCGMFADMVRLGVPLVVYTDELAHCGEGKELWKPGHAFEWPMSAFCSEFIPDSLNEENEKSNSRRILRVGRHEFVITYSSSGSWMSNVDGDYEVTNHRFPRPGYHSDLLAYPMYAIDFVVNGDDFVYFDLNTMPGVPVEVVNMVGRDVLQQSVADFCRSRGLIA
jgi:hypothetical protein